MINRLRSRLTYILKHNMVINKLFNVVMSTSVKFMGVFIKTRNDSIFFCAQNGKYNDSSRTIYEYMIQHPDYKNMRFVWAADKKYQDQIPGECVKVVPDTLNYFIETLRCKYWVASVNVERSLKFKKRSIRYLNTWHGTPLKTIGNAAKGRKDYDFSYINLFCSAGEYETEIYKRDFNVNPDSIINTGLPRNDELYHIYEHDAQILRQKLNIPDARKVILYAPTWRDSNDGGKTYGIKPPIDFSQWEKILSNEYVVLLRAHPYTTSLLGVEFNSFVRDVTNYPEINDLLKVSDVLISDYSATIFDYSILGKPIICFAYDYDTYAKERGLYANLEDILPGGVLRTQEELLFRIQNIDFLKDGSVVKEFSNKFLQYGGNATQLCVKALMSK